MTDGLVKHQTLNKDGNEVVIYEVSGQAEVHKTLRYLEALGEYFGIAHLHTEQRSLVLHSDMLGTIRELQMTEVRQVLKDDVHIKMRKELPDLETEHLVTSSL